MNLRTFYRLFYKHRIKKASFFLRIYIFFVAPLKYLVNIFYFEKKVNLDLYKNNFPDLFKKDLNILFEHFNSDKGEYFINQYLQPAKKNKEKIKAHGYAKIYETVFTNFKKKKINILELGSFYGNAAAALFFYFDKASIFSADINPDMFKYKSNRITNFFIDSSSEKSLKNDLLSKKNNFDIIIEDASHMLKDQIISLFILFPLVNSGGYFIVEELDFPETREDMRIDQTKPDLKQILQNILKNTDFNSIYISDDEKKYFLENYSSIEIKKGNFNEIAIIKKK
tara:strand:+ start:137 stop:985 length:849 start_codon:yes stop_codon:yes gene_type:complete